MIAFEDCFSPKNIINYLSKQRAKIAKKRSKLHILNSISKSKRYNYHSRVREETENNEVCFMMPPRRLWVSPGFKKRYKNSEALNSIDKNQKAIFSTIQKHYKLNEKYKYMKKLDEFVKDIIVSINSIDFEFKSPKIQPARKSKESSICRPISIFSLKDNLINCLTNKYLVHYFDDLFYENSFAFRAGRKFDNDTRVPTHHDAFKKIIDYLQENQGKTIYVAECDMQKFYDTVHHRIVMKQFRRLCLKNLFKCRCDKRAKRIFIRYLECYSFYNNVSKLDVSFFEKYKIKDGSFEWVKGIEDYYKTKRRELANIGIPQGGALSGLIANIVLNLADEKVLKLNYKDLLYIRYCDDMIMMHTEEKKCNTALKVYIHTLERLKLFPHKINNINYSKEFWASKSKGPYIWDKENTPWIGFVGYEINRNGDIRIRKKSLKKEKDKQNELINDVITAIKNDNLKTSKNTVIESTYKRLNGMSVGRVELWNHKNYKNDMCWVKGFNLLNNNKYSRIQVRSLDKSKKKALVKLYKYLGRLDDSHISSKTNEIEKEKIFYGKPFSYFYQAIERHEE
jgi:hypothetical protein